MSVASIPHSPPPVDTPVDPSKRRRVEIDLTEEKEEPMEQAPPLFDFSPLCNFLANIFGDPEENSSIRPREAADLVVQSDPSLLLSLSQLNKESFQTLIDQQFLTDPTLVLQKGQIKRTLMILYSMSLLNSSFGKMTESLETDIQKFLILTSKGHPESLIERARKIFSSSQATTEEREKQIIELTQVAEEINEYLNLHFYADKENREKIENIYRFTISDEGTRFPNCKRFFPLLCQNLQNQQVERKQLSELLRSLIQKKGELVTLSVKERFPERQKLSPERELLLEYRAGPLWSCGAFLIDQAFRNTFYSKKIKNRSMPQALIDSISAISQKPDFSQFSFLNLVREFPSELPSEFVYEVWIHYLGKESRIADLSDLMRHIVARLPDESFDYLERQLNTLNKNGELAVQKFLYQYLKHQIPGPAELTLPNMLNWLKATRAL